MEHTYKVGRLFTIRTKEAILIGITKLSKKGIKIIQLGSTTILSTEKRTKVPTIT